MTSMLSAVDVTMPLKLSARLAAPERQRDETDAGNDHDQCRIQALADHSRAVAAS
jgi:hypothetical protein